MCVYIYIHTYIYLYIYIYKDEHICLVAVLTFHIPVISNMSLPLPFGCMRVVVLHVSAGGAGGA